MFVLYKHVDNNKMLFRNFVQQKIEISSKYNLCVNFFLSFGFPNIKKKFNTEEC